MDEKPHDAKHSTVNSSPARSWLRLLASAAFAYGLLELVVQVAWSPEVVLRVDNLGQEVSADAMSSEALQAAREQAGLGFRDPSQSVHPYLGFVYVPTEERGAGAAGMFPISEEGFLTAGSVVRKRGPGKLVIGLTGGSVAGQLGSFYADFLKTAMHAHEVFADRELEFVWMGMPGYHQPQQAILLNYLLAQGAEFDAFVNLDGFNEIAVGPVLNAPRGTHPLFPMNWSMVALDVPDLRVRRTVGAIEHLIRARREAALAFADSGWAWSPLARLLNVREDERVSERIAAFEAELTSLPLDEVPWFVRGPARDHGPLEELVAEGARVWERCSRQLEALCRANGIRYVHVLQPNQYDTGSKELNEFELEAAWDDESPYKSAVEQGYPLLREAGKRLVAQDGIVFCDLSGIFQQVSGPVYSDACCHYNTEGNRLLSVGMAAALAEAFEGQG